MFISWVGYSWPNAKRGRVFSEAWPRVAPKEFSAANHPRAKKKDTTLLRAWAKNSILFRSQGILFWSGFIFKIICHLYILFGYSLVKWFITHDQKRMLFVHRTSAAGHTMNLSGGRGLELMEDNVAGVNYCQSGVLLLHCTDWRSISRGVKRKEAIIV